MIRSGHEKGVTTIVLDRPERRNALTREMNTALAGAVAAAGDDPGCHCLVIKGAGEHFCAGRDLEQAASLESLEETLADSAGYTAIYECLYRLSKPSVAVVRGYAVAGGFTLAMGCDFVLADETARFGALEMRGGFPAAVNTALLTRLAGPRRALELLLSTDLFPPAALLEMGLINRLLPDAPTLAEAETAMTAALAALDPMAVGLTKDMHRAASSMPPGDALTMASQLNALLVAGGRFRQGAEKLKGKK